MNERVVKLEPSLIPKPTLYVFNLVILIKLGWSLTTRIHVLEAYNFQDVFKTPEALLADECLAHSNARGSDLSCSPGSHDRYRQWDKH